MGLFSDWLKKEQGIEEPTGIDAVRRRVLGEETDSDEGLAKALNVGKWERMDANARKKAVADAAAKRAAAAQKRQEPEPVQPQAAPSPEPHKEKVASITKSQLETIAETKMKDLNANDLEAAVKIIAGTARSMGVTVEN